LFKKVEHNYINCFYFLKLFLLCGRSGSWKSWRRDARMCTECI